MYYRNERIRQKLLKFRDDRDWSQFHNPKDLAEAICVESGELLEKFLWLTGSESKTLPSGKLRDVEEEVADVAIFLTYLCESLNIDLARAVERKIESNAAKYPVQNAKGTSKKSKELGQ